MEYAAGDVRSTGLSLVSVGVIVVALLLETGGLRWPRLLFVLAVLLPSAYLIYVGRDTFSPLFLILLVSWLAYVGSRRESLLALVLTLVSLQPPLLARGNNYEDWVPWTFGIVFAWSSAYALAAQQRLLAELRAAQADLARQAAAEERRRIAREVHDVVAHSLAVTMLHLTGARHVLSRDPVKAAEALAQAEQLGRQSLADIRRTVGLLGSGQESSASTALPGINDLSRLVDEFAGAGLNASLHVGGDPERLSPAAGLDLYRIVQEALTNVAKHAPGARVEVELQVGNERAVLSVRDYGGDRPHPLASAAGSGLGILGMRERAALLGGNLTAERDGAGWLVMCSVPLPAGGSTPPTPHGAVERVSGKSGGR